jgi:hypothetical protein
MACAHKIISDNPYINSIQSSQSKRSLKRQARIASIDIPTKEDVSVLRSVFADNADQQIEESLFYLDSGQSSEPPGMVENLEGKPPDPKRDGSDWEAFFKEVELLYQWRLLIAIGWSKIVMILYSYHIGLCTQKRRSRRPSGRRKAVCSTMPYDVLPSLCVLWGVCWMFYKPESNTFGLNRTPQDNSEHDLSPNFGM